MKEDRKHHISMIEDKRACVIAAELSPKSRYGMNDTYNRQLIGAALWLTAHGMSGCKYISSGGGTSCWSTEDTKSTVICRHDLAIDVMTWFDERVNMSSVPPALRGATAMDEVLDIINQQRMG